MYTFEIIKHKNNKVSKISKMMKFDPANEWPAKLRLKTKQRCVKRMVYIYTIKLVYAFVSAKP